MSGPKCYHTKWSKSDWERHILYDIVYMQSLKNDTNILLQTERFTKVENELMVTRGKG